MRGLNITTETLTELQKSLTDYGKEYHIEVVVVSGCLLKTIDNEADARITINNIKNKMRN